MPSNQPSPLPLAILSLFLVGHQGCRCSQSDSKRSPGQRVSASEQPIGQGAAVESPASVTAATAQLPAPATESRDTLDLVVRRGRASSTVLTTLSDGAAILGLASRWLRQRLPGVRDAGEIRLSRIAGSGSRLERLRIGDRGDVRLEVPSTRVTVSHEAGRCQVRSGGVQARCYASDASTVRALAALWATLNFDGPRPLGVRLEGLWDEANGQQASLMVASTTLAMRWLLVVERRTGALARIVFGHGDKTSTLVLEGDKDPRIVVREHDGQPRSWTLAPGQPGDAAAQGPVVTETPLTRIAGIQDAARAARDLVARLGGVTTDPHTLRFRWRDGKLTLEAMALPTIIAAEVQHAAVKRLPALADEAKGLVVPTRRLAAALAKQRVEPGCYLAQLLGHAPDQPANRSASAMFALRPCPRSESAEPAAAIP